MIIYLALLFLDVMFDIISAGMLLSVGYIGPSWLPVDSLFIIALLKIQFKHPQVNTFTLGNTPIVCVYIINVTRLFALVLDLTTNSVFLCHFL